MVVCKFFLRGDCRFGNRCWNEHTQSDKYNRYSSGYHDSRAGSSRPASPDSYDSRYSRPASPDSYDSRYRYSSPDRNYRSQSHYQNTHWNSRDAQSSDSYHNPYAPYQSPDPYRSPYDYQPSRYDVDRSTYNKSPVSSTPKNIQPSASEFSKNRFSALENLEDEKKSNLKSDAYVKAVIEDAVSRDKGGQWPFSCYCILPGKPNFPDLEDISAEELRYEAYEAEKRNEFPKYVESVANALNTVRNKWTLMQSPTPDIIKTIKEIQKGIVKPSNDSIRKKLTFDNLSDNHFGTQDSSNEKVSNFSFKEAVNTSFRLDHLFGNKPNVEEITSMNDEPISTDSAFSNFHFTLPHNSEEKSIFGGQTGFLQNISVTPELSSSGTYTQMENLTEEEKTLFAAPTFAVGKIPIKPPPKEMCF